MGLKFNAKPLKATLKPRSLAKDFSDFCDRTILGKVFRFAKNRELKRLQNSSPNFLGDKGIVQRCLVV